MAESKDLDDEFKKNFDELQRIGEAHKLTTVWSVKDVSAKMLNDKFPGQVKKIFYSHFWPNQEIRFHDDRQLTWLDMWIEADKLMRQCEDNHHVYVEAFEEDEAQAGTYILYSGS